MIRQSPASTHWEKIGIQNHHGICVFLSALHHEDCGGIGEFYSLIPMIDWCKKVGFDVLQLLPLYDTGRHISPYSLLSAFALHPMYLDVKEFCSEREWRQLRNLAKEEWVQQEKVWEIKSRILRKYFDAEKQEIQKRQSYRRFLKENPWVFEYADYRGDVEFHSFLQYLCFKQMEKVKRYAEKKGVLLMGDLPILIDFQSADLVKHSEMFHHDVSAGAPPDSFSAKGQNWGFPVYDFQHHFEAIMSWWEKRLESAEELFHMYRIDHVVGFFRLWAIPKGKRSIEGRFFPKAPNQWRRQGKEILRRFLDVSKMLPIAEDLGVIPNLIRETMSELGIPGTKVMRWEKINNKYISPKRYPPCSMTTVSTHDTETLQQWWRVQKDEAKAFCKFMGWKWESYLSKEWHREILSMSHHSSSLFHINLLQEYFPLVDGLSWSTPSHERINNPGRKLKNNWRYRYRPSIEELFSHSELERSIRQLISENQNE